MVLNLPKAVRSVVDDEIRIPSNRNGLVLVIGMRFVTMTTFHWLWNSYKMNK